LERQNVRVKKQDLLEVAVQQCKRLDPPAAGSASGTCFLLVAK
jgi:hypothetical protein